MSGLGDTSIKSTAIILHPLTSSAPYRPPHLPSFSPLYEVPVRPVCCAQLGMRIILLPLTRRQTLLYAHRLTENESHKPNPYIAWAIHKAQTKWKEWGKSDTKWKSKTAAIGNKLLDKIEWEEYSLKTVHDPKSTTTDKVRFWLGGGG